MYKQIVIASGSDNNHVSLRHSPRQFPEENLVEFIYVSSTTISCGALNSAGILGWHMPELLLYHVCGAVCHTHKKITRTAAKHQSDTSYSSRAAAAAQQ